MVWKQIARNLLTRALPASAADTDLVKTLSARLRAAEQRRLGRDLSIRHIAAGSCNGCELELRATRNLIYNLAQYGLNFTVSPRHADILLVTGVGNLNMRDAVLQTRAAMPDPVFVVAVGDCAVDGGIFKGSPAKAVGLEAFLPVDLVISGCPPPPQDVIRGLLALLEAHGS